MTNALTDVPSISSPDPTVSPLHGDVVLAPQADGGCLLAQHPGGWQIAFATHADAVDVAVRFATASGARVWLRREDDYAPIAAGERPAGDIGSTR